MSVWHRVTDYEGELHAGNVWYSSPRNLPLQAPAETARQNNVTPPNLHNACLDGGTRSAPNYMPLFGVQYPSASANLFSRRSAAGSNSMRSWGKSSVLQTTHLFWCSVSLSFSKLIFMLISSWKQFNEVLGQSSACQTTRCCSVFLNLRLSANFQGDHQ